MAVALALGTRALRLLRLAVGQDRPQEDHDGRLPPRRAHVLPDLQGDDPLRQPRARGVRRRRRRSRSTANDCQMHLFPQPEDRVQRLRQGAGLPRQAEPVLRDHRGAAGRERRSRRSTTSTITGWRRSQADGDAEGAGLPGRRRTRTRSTCRCSILLVFIQVLYVTMVYGPIAAFLVELFPTRIRYTSMSLPYHIGNGWFGGMLPLTAAALVAANGQHLRGSLVSGHRRGDHLRHRHRLHPRDEGPPHQHALERRNSRGVPRLSARNTRWNCA